jgi:hypothetical protein
MRSQDDIEVMRLLKEDYHGLAAFTAGNLSKSIPNYNSH